MPRMTDSKWHIRSSISELESLRLQVEQRIKEVPVIPVSMSEGYEELKPHIKTGLTYCLLGSSGVGKSTLINQLMGQELMKTGSIRKLSSSNI